MDGSDGDRGPGLAWTAGHVCFLAGLVCFVQAFRAMWTLAGRTRLATAGFDAGIAGAVASGVQFVIDVVVGFLSEDRAGMDSRFGSIQEIPGVEAAFYSYGPMLFFAGMVVLVALLAARRRVKPWAPVLVLAEIPAHRLRATGAEVHFGHGRCPPVRAQVTAVRVRRRLAPDATSGSTVEG